MKGKLFLSGGGDTKQTKKFDKFFASFLKGDKSVLYIPIAMPRRTYTHRECFEWVSKTLEGVGLNNLEMWTSIKNRKYSELKDFSAVYIGGGNTYGLLDKISRSGFDKLLLRYLKKGGILYGGSAGAIIQGKDIQTAGFGGDCDRNFLGLSNFKGLDLLQGYSIQAHYSKKDDLEMLKYFDKTKISVIALPEETGLFVEKNIAKIIGYKDAYLFSEKGKKTLKEGSKFKLKIKSLGCGLDD